MSERQSKYRIFIIDDDPFVLDILETMLADCPEYEITKFLSSPDALNAVTDRKPDIVILDINMPIMNGFEICHALKSNTETRHVSVILATAHDSKHSQCDGLVKYGADSYIPKPINRDRLLACLQNIIKVREKQNPENRNSLFSRVI